MSKPTVLICLQCGSAQRDEHGCKLPNPEAAKLHADVREILANDYPDAAGQLEVKMVRCFAHCESPIAWGLRDSERFNYTFAPATDAADIAFMAARWLTADPKGRMPGKEMPPQVRKTFQSRIPPIPEE